MAVTALGPEILTELRAGSSADSLPTVLDDLSLTIDRECLSGSGEVPTSTAAWVGRLRKIARAKLNLWGLSDLVEDAQLLISELVTNGFKHGTRGQIVFHLVIGVEALVVEVDDGSPGRPEVRATEPESVGGRGMILISALAASWGVSEDGTRTWFALRVSKTDEGIGLGSR